MSKHLERELEFLKKKLLAISADVEETLQRSIHAFEERRADLAENVIAHDDQIDRGEVELEEECLKALALYQPVAADLRFIAAVLKINNDLERMADGAVGIARRTRHLARRDPIETPFEVSAMANASRRMVHDAMEAFVRRDTGLARKICAMDDEVDAYNGRIISELKKIMTKSPKLVEQALDIFTVTRQLERVADLATNVAEDVVYMVEGDIIRHIPLEPSMSTSRT